MHNITFSFNIEVDSQGGLSIENEWPEPYLKLEAKVMVHVLRVACQYLYGIIKDSKVTGVAVPPQGSYIAVVSIDGNLITAERQYTAQLIVSDSFEGLSVPAANLCLQKIIELFAHQATTIVNSSEARYG